MAIIPRVWIIECACVRSSKSEEVLFADMLCTNIHSSLARELDQRFLCPFSVDGHQGEASSYGVVCCVVLI